MPKNKVNNNIKLKSGGGVINDATDGLSVDTGTTANKLVRLDGNAKLPAVDGSNLTGIAQIIPSLIIRVSADTARTTTSLSPEKLKEIRYNEISGTITVSFTHSRVSGNGKSKAQIYKNGVAFGTERESVSLTTYTENLSFSQGDLIQIYAWTTYGSSGTIGEVSNFRLLYDKTPPQITNTVVTN